MAYLGNVPAEAYTNTVKDSFNGDASTTAFTLSQPSTTNNLRVVVENVIQDPTVAYTVSGTTLTFTSAPPVGTANIYAVHLGPAVMTAVPPTEITNATTYTSDLTVQGDLTVDTNTLYVDSTNNRVGMGTASPSATLDVNGTIKLDGDYPTGTGNVALGDTALDDGSYTGNYTTAIGSGSFSAATSGGGNVGVGFSTGRVTTTGANNVFIGAPDVGGYTSGWANTTGSYNIGIGAGSLGKNTTASNSVAVGYQAGYSLSTNSGNVFVGYLSGQATTSPQNTFIGSGSGYLVSSGQKNTIIGTYSGNQGGLDIRTSDNNIVLSDGDGNPKLVYMPLTGGGAFFFRKTTGFGTSWTDGSAAIEGFDNGPYMVMSHPNGTTSGRPYAYWFYNNNVIGSITQNGTTGVAYNTSSDYRLKENVIELTGATDRIKQIPVHRFNFIADPDRTVDGFLAHEVQAIVPEAIHGTKDEVDADGNPVYQGIDQSKLVPLLVATIKELEARITALENA